jgi:hypothetical protein
MSYSPRTALRRLLTVIVAVGLGVAPAAPGLAATTTGEPVDAVDAVDDLGPVPPDDGMVRATTDDARVGASSVLVPRPVAPFTVVPDELARYVGQVSCEPAAKPGTLALRDLIVATYGPPSIGTLRGCTVGGTSEHKDGRALDWMLDASKPADKAKATAFLNWLVGPDADGVVAGNARRLGVMYVIWDRQTWKSYRGVWEPYSGASPHTDHIHISLSWNGAMKRTSWWSGQRTDRDDYGPCQVYIGERAPLYSGPRYEPCPKPVVRPGRAHPRLWDADTAPDVLVTTSVGGLLMYPGTGTGGFRSSVQIGKGWSGMDVVTAAGDFDKDGRRDLVARGSTGRLYLYRGNGQGGFLGSAQIGKGWGGMRSILGAGDLDADGNVDLLAHRASDGAAVLYPGNGSGGFKAPLVAADLTGRDMATAAGDWDGDGKADVVARDVASGRLLLYPGTGNGRLGAPREIGKGWGGMTALVGIGDFSGDGKPDIVARHENGRLHLYRGDGKGGFAGTAQIGQGWGALRLAG